MKSEIFTTSPWQTKKIGKILAKEILRKKLFLKQALVLALTGELGGGKTTFLQGFGKGLNLRQKILSPTFIVMKKFPISDPKFRFFYHLDCYRIQTPKEILDLGFKKILSDPHHIVAIEWADKIRKIVPQSALWIRFEFINEKTRKITISEKLKTKNKN